MKNVIWKAVLLSLAVALFLGALSLFRWISYEWSGAGKMRNLVGKEIILTEEFIERQRWDKTSKGILEKASYAWEGDKLGITLRVYIGYEGGGISTRMDPDEVRSFIKAQAD